MIALSRRRFLRGVVAAPFPPVPASSVLYGGAAGGWMTAYVPDERVQRIIRNTLPLYRSWSADAPHWRLAKAA